MGKCIYKQQSHTHHHNFFVSYIIQVQMDNNQNNRNDRLANLELQTKKYIKEVLEPMGGQWQEQMRVDKSNISNRIDALQNSLVQYEKKLDILQRDATELTAAYEKQSTSIESDLDSKTVFQSILD